MKAKDKCKCPYCNGSIDDDFCKLCRIKFISCTNCGHTIAANLEKCPICGAKDTSKKK